MDGEKCFLENHQNVPNYNIKTRLLELDKFNEKPWTRIYALTSARYELELQEICKYKWEKEGSSQILVILLRSRDRGKEIHLEKGIPFKKIYLFVDDDFDLHPDNNENNERQLKELFEHRGETDGEVDVKEILPIKDGEVDVKEILPIKDGEVDVKEILPIKENKSTRFIRKNFKIILSLTVVGAVLLFSQYNPNQLFTFPPFPYANHYCFH